MAALSFIAMDILMYAMVDRPANVFPNLNQAYMADLMTAPMVIIELLVMRPLDRITSATSESFASDLKGAAAVTLRAAGQRRRLSRTSSNSSILSCRSRSLPSWKACATQCCR
jgi:hypothetical protein